MSLYSTTSWADEDNPRDPKLVFNVGFYHLSGISSDILATDGSGLSVGVSFENTLNLPNSADVQRLDGYYRYSDRNRIEFSYYGISRTGVVDLTGTPVNIGGVIFNDVTASTNESTILKAVWSHSYIKDKKFDFGIGGGVYLSSAKATVYDVGTPSTNVSTDVTLPLPVFSLRGAWNIRPKLKLWAKQDLFVLDVADLSSALTDFTIALEHQTTKNVGFGANLNYFNTTASTTINGNDARILRRYRGAMVYAKIAL
ncbi:MAG: hypothetical protein AMJ68_07020 [Acidithiobacillales bacterium SG8_45]|nr:MAG: hypothetical protein AMJ68_07020 [Acidithiobacillales bacterium SG8_45]